MLRRCALGGALHAISSAAPHRLCDPWQAAKWIFWKSMPFAVVEFSRDHAMLCYVQPKKSPGSRIVPSHTRAIAKTEARLFGKVVEVILTIVRAFHLGFLFAPVFLSAPPLLLMALNRDAWMELLYRTLRMAGPAFIKWGQVRSALPLASSRCLTTTSCSPPPLSLPPDTPPSRSCLSPLVPLSSPIRFRLASGPPPGRTFSLRTCAAASSASRRTPLRTSSGTRAARWRTLSASRSRWGGKRNQLLTHACVCARIDRMSCPCAVVVATLSAIMHLVAGVVSPAGSVWSWALCSDGTREAILHTDAPPPFLPPLGPLPQPPPFPARVFSHPTQ